MRRYDSQDARRRVLAACARLFLEKGYTKTRMVDILREADVSSSSFQNIFGAKDGVLTAFVEIMFSGQFDAARQLAAEVSRYRTAMTPAIILIPGREGSLGIGKSNIQSAIERAVGADIL